MPTAAEMFEKFKGSGLLTAATHAPAGGGASTAFEARLMKGGDIGIALIDASELAIQFIAADVPGFAQGDTVTINATAYKVRDRLREACKADGTLIAYRIRET